MSAPMKPPRSPFIAPAWIALASVVGLVSALIGDGLLDLISWLVFTALIALVVRAWVKRTR
jgi:polyferredoxin